MPRAATVGVAVSCMCVVGLPASEQAGVSMSRSASRGMAVSNTVGVTGAESAGVAVFRAGELQLEMVSAEASGGDDDDGSNVNIGWAGDDGDSVELCRGEFGLEGVDGEERVDKRVLALFPRLLRLLLLLFLRRRSIADWLPLFKSRSICSLSFIMSLYTVLNRAERDVSTLCSLK